jgi:hypothetical protein
MHIWDIDHTYLNLPREELKRLLQPSLEAFEKERLIPGSASLLRSLQQHSESLAFISAAPEMARANLKRKMRMDGVIHPRLILRRKLSLGRRLFQRSYNDLPAFKLLHLLRLSQQRNKAQRTGKAPKSRPHSDYLVGTTQDWDVFSYLLWGQILQGLSNDQELAFYLGRSGASHRRIHQILQQSKKLSQLYPSEDKRHRSKPPPPRIILYRDRALGLAAPFYAPNPFLRISRNHFQTALFLYTDKVLAREDLLHTAQEMAMRLRRYSSLFTASLADLYRRGYLSKGQWCRLGHYLWRFHLLQDRHHGPRPCFGSKQYRHGHSQESSIREQQRFTYQNYTIQRSLDNKGGLSRIYPKIDISSLLQLLDKGNPL